MSVEAFERAYYGKNYDKVISEGKKEREKLKADFLKKYPNADISKFEFNAYYNQDNTLESTSIYFKNSDIFSTDIKSNTFLDDRSMTKYLYSNKVHNLPPKHPDFNKDHNHSLKHSAFPKLFQSGGTIQQLSRGNKHKGFAFEKNHTWFWDEFPVDYVLNYPVNKYKIYVSNLDYFHSNLPELDTTIDQQLRKTKADKFDMSQHYYNSLVGAYVAPYVCGISKSI